MTQNIKNKLLAHNFVGKFEHPNFKYFFAKTIFELNFSTASNSFAFLQLEGGNNTKSTRLSL